MQKLGQKSYPIISTDLVIIIKLNTINSVVTKIIFGWLFLNNEKKHAINIESKIN